MTVHNQVEESVFEAVSQVFDDIRDSGSSDVCGCNQCRLDVACYVLNRLKPRYVVSERGFTHLEVDRTSQQTADLMAHITDGIERVSTTKRPHFPHGAAANDSRVGGTGFDFPVVSGRVYNGLNFEPLRDVQALLTVDGQSADMMSAGWQNPLSIHAQAEGHYSFWPATVYTDTAGERRVFDFNLLISGAGFENVSHFFQMNLVSTVTTAQTPSNTFAVGALYAFPS